MRIEIHGTSINDRIVDQAVDILKNGGLIIYPTDTVYGLGCDITQKAAIKESTGSREWKSRNLLVLCAQISKTYPNMQKFLL